jgi:hypothetical protein
MATDSAYWSLALARGEIQLTASKTRAMAPGPTEAPAERSGCGDAVGSVPVLAQISVSKSSYIRSILLNKARPSHPRTQNTDRGIQ